MGLWGLLTGGAVESSGKAVSGVMDSAGGLAASIRSAITGELPPEKQVEVERLLTELDTVIAAGQVRLNEIEAQSPSMFKSGWRPFLGWVCAFGFTYTVGLQPLLSWVSAIAGLPVLPTIETGALMTVPVGMLGLGGIRTIEKRNGLTR